jgi:hypothetical protein
MSVHDVALSCEPHHVGAFAGPPLRTAQRILFLGHVAQTTTEYDCATAAATSVTASIFLKVRFILRISPPT